MKALVKAEIDFCYEQQSHLRGKTAEETKRKKREKVRFLRDLQYIVRKKK